MPILFELYYLSGFNLELFLERNEAHIRDVAITNFSFSATDTIKQYYISKLIIDNNINKYYGRILKLKYKYY